MKIHVASSAELSAHARDEILALCDRAYGEDLQAAFETFRDPIHVLATVDGAVVSHALWYNAASPYPDTSLTSARITADAKPRPWCAGSVATASTYAVRSGGPAPGASHRVTQSAWLTTAPSTVARTWIGSRKVSNAARSPPRTRGRRARGSRRARAPRARQTMPRESSSATARRFRRQLERWAGPGI